MTNQSLVRDSFFLLSLLSLGSFAPAATPQFDEIPLDRLRLAAGPSGIGLGAVVVPSANDRGQLDLALYNDQDVALFQVDASLSLYVSSALVASRTRFGGITGQLRGVQSGTTMPPLSLSHIDGTWELDGQGRGTLHCIVYRMGSDGQRVPLGIINGEFDAVEVVVAGWEPATDISVGSASGYLASAKRGRQKLVESNEFSGAAEAFRRRVAMIDFALRDSGLELRIREARQQAKQDRIQQALREPSSVSSEPSTYSSQAHLAGMVLAHYKLAR